MIVRESISFQRYKDPKDALGVGKNSKEAREYTFEKLQEEGAKFYFYGTEEEKEQQKNIILENIYDLEKTLKKCKNIINVNEITVYNNRINLTPINLYKIVYAGHILFPAASKEDANFIVEVLSNLIVDDYKKERFKIELERSSVSSHLSLDTVNEIVDDILKFRQKFKKQLEEAPDWKNYDI